MGAGHAPFRLLEVQNVRSLPSERPTNENNATSVWYIMLYLHIQYARKG